jgi:hypothetical protein
LQLAREEPEAGPWRAELLTAVIGELVGRGPGRVESGRPVVLAVDGRSNAGKTTLAARICAAVPGSVVVHTDDIAWEHSRFGWSDLLVDAIQELVRQGRGVNLSGLCHTFSGVFCGVGSACGWRGSGAQRDGLRP